MSERDDAPRPPARGTPALEWVAASVGAAVLAAALGVILWSDLSKPAGPPDVEVRLVSVEPAGAGHLVRFIARNVGHAPAAAVRVQGRLAAGDATLETRGVEIDYLPQDGERRGGLWFERDPAAGRLSLRADGYVEP